MGGKQKKALARLHSGRVAHRSAALRRPRRRLVRGPIRGALSRMNTISAAARINALLTDAGQSPITHQAISDRLRKMADDGQ